MELQYRIGQFSLASAMMRLIILLWQLLTYLQLYSSYFNRRSSNYHGHSSSAATYSRSCVRHVSDSSRLNYQRSGNIDTDFCSHKKILDEDVFDSSSFISRYTSSVAYLDHTITVYHGRHVGPLFTGAPYFQTKKERDAKMINERNLQTKIPLQRGTNNLITDLDKSSVRINNLRWIAPGDYVVHKELGIGKYLGIRMINLTPLKETKPVFEPVVVVKFLDGEVTWLKRFVEKELWLYRSGAGENESGNEQDEVIEKDENDNTYYTAQSTNVALADLAVSMAGSGVKPKKDLNMSQGKYELSSILDIRKWRKRRIAAEELNKQTALNLIRLLAIRNSYHRIPYVSSESRYRAFESRFAYTPTEDQLECFKNIERDMVNSTRPMDRLICGDVGFGKTEVAMRAVYRSYLSKKQAVVLAPTRVLALQHLRVLQNRMPDVSVQLLRGGSKSDSQNIKEDIASGSCQIVVGTHAVLQSDVKFKNLGLVVIDEEQRFGVLQKEKLKSISSGIDVLTLSATPIPRTLQMSLTGLRDFSLIGSPPIGRKEVSVYVGLDNDTIIGEAINQEVRRGGQVFLVVPYIKDIPLIVNRLSIICPDIPAIDAHGRHTNLEDRIDYFSSGQAKILIATTVIENGIDMPNVNTIIVLSADRFGMSQLYQLRGRVGRSSKQAYAYFLTDKDKVLTIEAESRLMHLKTYTALGSGYDLARRDMEMRGHGTIFGSDQSGSRDVGIDLQTVILQNAVDDLKTQFILSVPETRISIPSKLEDYGRSWLKRDVPSLEDVAGIARWENNLALNVIKRCFLTANQKNQLSTTSESYENAAARSNDMALHKRDKMDASEISNDSPLSLLIDESAAQLTSCSSYSDIISLRQKWRDLFSNQVPILLSELLYRFLTRITCRKLGIHSVEYQSEKQQIILESKEINQEKWRNVTAALSKSHAMASVSFISRNKDNDRVGNILIHFPNATEKTIVPSLDIYKSIVQVLYPIGEAADKRLNDAVAACNTNDRPSDSEDEKEG